MKHYYKLTCFFFRYLKWITLGMILLAAAAELGWLWYSAQQPEAAYATYQLMVYNPGRWFHVSKIFSIVFALFCVAISLWILASFHGKRHPLYTLLTLPGPRAALPFAMFTAVLLAFALFLLAQCGILFAGYHLWAHQTPIAAEAYLSQIQSTDPTVYEALHSANVLPFVNNDLYLAFVHSPVGALVLPSTPLYALYPLGLCGLFAASNAFDFLMSNRISVATLYITFTLTDNSALSEYTPAFGALFLVIAVCLMAYTVYRARRSPLT